MKILRLTVAAAALATTALAGASSAIAKDSDHDWSELDLLFLIWSQSSNPFFEAVVDDAQDAAEDQGVNIDVQYGEEDPVTQSNILETAIASGIDGIATIVADDNAYDDILCGAMEKGIPVVTFNIDDSEGADAPAGWRSWARISLKPAI